MLHDDPLLWPVSDLISKLDLLNFSNSSSDTNTFNVDLMEGKADNFYFAISGIVLIICALLATLGNGAIVAVVIRKGLPQTVTHLLVVNLAVAHLLLSLTCTPLDAGYLLTSGNWLTGDYGCRFQRFASTTLSSAAILTLSTIAVDRYYSVVYPLENKITMYKGKLMIVYVWCHAIIISLPKAIICKVSTTDKEREVCDEEWNSLTKARIYLVCYSTLTIFGPLILTSTSYCLVWRAFRISQRRVNVMNSLKRPKTVSYLPYASKTEVRLLKMLFFMVFCFVVLWSPLVVQRFLKYFNPDLKLSEYFILTSEWFCRIQPVLDPVIYGYLNKQFRKSLCDMLRVCSQCSLYYSNDMTISTMSGENTPYSSEQFDFTQGTEQFDQTDESTRNDGCFCCCTHKTSVVDVPQPANMEPTQTAVPTGNNTNQDIASMFTAKNSHTPSLSHDKKVLPNETPNISYITKCDPVPQRRSSVTYHISGSVKLMPDAHDNEDSASTRPKPPVWYLGGTFPLNSNPIRNISRLPPIGSNDTNQTGSKEDGTKTTLSASVKEAQGNSSTLNKKDSETIVKKKRKRKKILSKRIEAKKWYSSGGVYLGGQS